MTGTKRFRRARNQSKRRAAELQAAWKEGNRAATKIVSLPHFGDVDLDRIDKDQVYVELRCPVLALRHGRRLPVELDIVTVRLKRVRRMLRHESVTATWTEWVLA